MTLKYAQNCAPFVGVGRVAGSSLPARVAEEPPQTARSFEMRLSIFATW